MSKNLNFDFCIISTPSSDGNKKIIFIARSGDNFLDKSLINNKDYIGVKKIIEDFGYVETEHLKFEPLINKEKKTISLKKIKSSLEEFGLNYSNKLKTQITKDLEILKESNINQTNPSTIKKTKFNYKEPEISNKVTLYFYLFLEFGFNQFGKPIVQFGGDFYSSEDYDDRNYIKIVSSDFERVVDPKRPNSIILSSCKTQSDLLRESGILYSGSFKYQKNIEDINSVIIQEKKYQYKLVELRSFINPKHPVVIETNRDGYDNLITLSNKLKAESLIESRQYISILDLEQKSQKICQSLNNKIDILSAKEQYEEAAIIKKDVDFINNQLLFIKSKNKYQITNEEYFNFFPIN